MTSQERKTKLILLPKKQM